jgi:hypothetical protein
MKSASADLESMALANLTGFCVQPFQDVRMELSPHMSIYRTRGTANKHSQAATNQPYATELDFDTSTHIPGAALKRFVFAGKANLKNVEAITPTCQYASTKILFKLMNQKYMSEYSLHSFCRNVCASAILERLKLSLASEVPNASSSK